MTGQIEVAIASSGGCALLNPVGFWPFPSLDEFPFCNHHHLPAHKHFNAVPLLPRFEQ
jgi:hypothetical protein